MTGSRTCPYDCGKVITRRRGNLKVQASIESWLDDALERHKAACLKRPCTDCGSNELCAPECRLAPWNQKEKV